MLALALIVALLGGWQLYVELRRGRFPGPARAQ